MSNLGYILLLSALIPASAALAQQTGNDTSVATETQERYSEDRAMTTRWACSACLAFWG